MDPMDLRTAIPARVGCARPPRLTPAPTGTWQKTGYFHRVRAGGPPAVLAKHPSGMSCPGPPGVRASAPCLAGLRCLPGACARSGNCPHYLYICDKGPFNALRQFNTGLCRPAWEPCSTAPHTYLCRMEGHLAGTCTTPAHRRPGACPQTRKPGGLSEVDSLPGLTADTTVFAIVSQGGDEGPPCEEARYCLQGVPWKFHLLHRGTECPSAGEFASSGDA